MAKPLQGVKVIEVAMWAFVPAAGGMLADLGADVIKIEPPTGDPLRGLNIQGPPQGAHGFVVSWENYNRGKRSITLDLREPRGLEVLHKLLATADVFLTNLLPAARRRMKIDVDDLCGQFPNLIYALGSGLGRHGPESEKGGYDSITYWGRSGISSSTTPEDADFPIGLPGAAFGDCASGAMLAGGVSAAIAKRAMTGEPSVVDVSLLAAGMWSMQRNITQAALDNVERFPRPRREEIKVPMVGTYKTKDGRFISLGMLQAQRYWADFCRVVGRPELVDDPRFASDVARAQNAVACTAELDALFATHTLAEWREILARQGGPWDVVQHPGELRDDPQVKANNYLQSVDYGEGRIMRMVSVPMQFDGVALTAQPAPALGAHSDAILGELGYDENTVIDLKVAGVVF